MSAGKLNSSNIGKSFLAESRCNAGRSLDNPTTSTLSCAIILLSLFIKKTKRSKRLRLKSKVSLLPKGQWVYIAEGLSQNGQIFQINQDEWSGRTLSVVAQRLAVRIPFQGHLEWKGTLRDLTFESPQRLNGSTVRAPTTVVLILHCWFVQVYAVMC